MICVCFELEIGFPKHKFTLFTVVGKKKTLLDHVVFLFASSHPDLQSQQRLSTRPCFCKPLCFEKKISIQFNERVN